MCYVAQSRSRASSRILLPVASQLDVPSCAGDNLLTANLAVPSLITPGILCRSLPERHSNPVKVGHLTVSMKHKKSNWGWVCALLLCALMPAFFLSCQRARAGSAGGKKLIILGIDGMDPDLLTKFMAEGKMPNFARLAEQGSFRRLTTSIPPQSPVAWSNLITGMNAGGHGIFDFIHRDPKTFQLYFSTSRVEGPKHSLTLGNWVIPLGSGTAEQLRHGKAFWEILDEHRIPNSVYRIPANFPPISAKGKTLSGMGTPDLRGTYGTFTFYTDDATAVAGAVEGGEVVQVEVQNNRMSSNLIGPGNTFRKNSPPATEGFTVDVDPLEPVARVSFQNQQFVLKEGEWSGWVPVEFQLMPIIGNVKGICRFFLKQAHPRFQLYVSPINIDPANPALPISTPSGYSRDLSKEIGEYHTQGIAEDTKALSDGVLDDKEYLEQARTVLAEHRRAFDAEFPKFQRGLFFFYFSSLDLNGHMMWRLTDPIPRTTRHWRHCTDRRSKSSISNLIRC